MIFLVRTERAPHVLNYCSAQYLAVQPIFFLCPHNAEKTNILGEHKAIHACLVKQNYKNSVVYQQRSQFKTLSTKSVGSFVSFVVII